MFTFALQRWARSARRASALLAGVLALNLASCGGGVGSGGTGTYASGSISGFGSIIVNGVRYDESAATIVDDDDRGRTRSELALGMTVEIDAGAIEADSAGDKSSASRVRFGSELLGPIESVDVAAGRFVVLGQAVAVGVETVFDERLTAGLSGLGVGQVVEVYAQRDSADAIYRATRVASAAGASAWRIRGVVTAVDPAARTLRIGTAIATWGAGVTPAADLAVGSLVRLTLAAGADSAGRYSVQSFSTAQRPPPDRDTAAIQGLITAWTSAPSFSVNGLAVDASQAAFPDGTAGLRLGARVEIKGRSVAGVLVATSVSLQTDQQVAERGFEFKGPITAVDAVARTITVKGQVISYARSDLRLNGGTLADLVVGRAVEVKAQLSPQRTGFEATRIEFK